MQQLSGILFPMLLLAAMYFIVIRPMNKRNREQQEMLRRLAVGENVVTRGGLIGRIAAMDDNTLTIDLDGRTKVRVLRTFVEGRYEPSINASGVANVKSGTTTASTDNSSSSAN